ncbi:BnaA05g29480D [Brassica napus]|uniref:BnaA05g29480D protein n=1 Tax=Brassica napus TaxID=3708 RepID=A0A078HDW6_BRANA|nr:BnaA05g29480D [Brassica napus]
MLEMRIYCMFKKKKIFEHQKFISINQDKNRIYFNGPYFKLNLDLLEICNA